MRFLPLVFFFPLFVCPHVEAAPPAGSFRLVRSMIGPSPKQQQAKFVHHQTDHRSPYPQSHAWDVFFACEAPTGNHVLTAFWKQPGGRIATISPDLKIETHTPELNAYWVYQLVPEMASGVWTVDVSIDGEPAGSQPFELVVSEKPKPNFNDPAALQLTPTLDAIYKATLPSMVWVHRLDEAGRRTDTAQGFVIGPNNVATAFQAIDSATHLEIEFANGRQVRAGELWTCNRLQDWAFIKVDTGGVAPLPRGNSKDVKIGERLIVFNVETDLRVSSVASISGRNELSRTLGNVFRFRLPPARKRLVDPSWIYLARSSGSSAEASRRVRGFSGATFR